MLILCDFDGTVTERDVTDLVWDGAVPRGERRQMVDRVTSGQWTMHEYIAHGYSYVEESPSCILSELVQKVRIRSGFSEFVEVVRSRGDHFHIVSNGLDFYIRALLPRNVEYSCFVGTFDGKYQVALPEGVTLRSGEDWKTHRVSELRCLHAGQTTIYIGDGRADFGPALLCDQVYAVRDSRLALMCREALRPVKEFERFGQLTRELYESATLVEPDSCSV